mmetsp:Transcript_58173/g.116908  ORF Transcript_58173/g.116908 Transcript_58173/m.116908 type:complete len:229 (+) Transcript_58173:284-970(+)
MFAAGTTKCGYYQMRMYGAARLFSLKRANVGFFHVRTPVRMFTKNDSPRCGPASAFSSTQNFSSSGSTFSPNARLKLSASLSSFRTQAALKTNCPNAEVVVVRRFSRSSNRATHAPSNKMARGPSCWAAMVVASVLPRPENMNSSGVSPREPAADDADNAVPARDEDSRPEAGLVGARGARRRQWNGWGAAAPGSAPALYSRSVRALGSPSSNVTSSERPPPLPPVRP